ncbi:E3 ubiquitin ligase BIG BROTHER-related [Linum grandiflorum]
MENNCSANTIAKPGSEAEPKPNDNNTATAIRENEQLIPKEPPNVSAPLTNGEAAAARMAGVQDVDVDDDAEDEDGGGSDMVDEDDDEEEAEELGLAPARNSPGRTPFTNLSQMDADLALARTLQEQDTWEEVDPDELSYEELLALGEVVGTESRGLSADTIANLPSVTYKTGSNQSGTSDSCVICRLDFEDEEAVTVLSCKHSYHAECINNWLKINKVCPVCSAEVSTSGGSQASS